MYYGHSRFGIPNHLERDDIVALVSLTLSTSAIQWPAFHLNP
jgi:hypothetical protein